MEGATERDSIIRDYKKTLSPMDQLAMDALVNKFEWEFNGRPFDEEVTAVFIIKFAECFVIPCYNLEQIVRKVENAMALYKSGAYKNLMQK